MRERTKQPSRVKNPKNICDYDFRSHISNKICKSVGTLYTCWPLLTLLPCCHNGFQLSASRSASSRSHYLFCCLNTKKKGGFPFDLCALLTPPKRVTLFDPPAAKQNCSISTSREEGKLVYCHSRLMTSLIFMLS